jgi:hypothetical protein
MTEDGIFEQWEEAVAVEEGVEAHLDRADIEALTQNIDQFNWTVGLHILANHMLNELRRRTEPANER